jgi:prevent-host-death family protein
MMAMKRANVSELKARLSSYLAAVRRGETVVVCDRQTPVARIVPYADEPDTVSLIPATRPASDWRRIKPVRLKRPVDVVELLREDRDQR